VHLGDLIAAALEETAEPVRHGDHGQGHVRPRGIASLQMQVEAEGVPGCHMDARIVRIETEPFRGAHRERPQAQAQQRRQHGDYRAIIL
jgi:hypothetical protein